ncbi:hypothetical protein SAV14893_029860 [Streptomyces avermitilis]|uniref:Uncharacterized protein n=1 Tax=Streptomyces avermitilis TaxID=33903 RepID=A0A4D4LZ18_STRAX|nr:hypothetical protein SAV14893_029860 [Streptomyces avermitilis]
MQLGAAAAGDHGADGDVRAAGVAGQQALVGGEEQHERGAVVRGGQLAQPGAQRGGHVEGDGGTGAVAHGGARPVGGQFERREVRQPALPVVEVTFDDLAGQLGALPGGVVRVLHGERGRGRARVQGAEFLSEDAGGPGVAGDVVEDHREDVLVVGEPDQARPHRPVAAEVERAGQVRLDQGADRVVVRGPGPVQGQGARRVDDLDGLVAVQGVAGAQDLVPLQQLVPGLVEGLGVEGAAQPQHQRDQVFGLSGSRRLRNHICCWPYDSGSGPSRSARGMSGRRVAPVRRPARRRRSSSARSASASVPERTGFSISPVLMPGAPSALGCS